LIISLLLPLFTTIGHFLLEFKQISGTEGKLLFTLFLSVPTVVINFFILGSFKSFFFRKKR